MHDFKKNRFSTIIKKGNVLLLLSKNRIFQKKVKGELKIKKFIEWNLKNIFSKLSSEKIK